MQKKSVRRTAALVGLLAAPLVLGSTVGAGTAGADPWHVGPVYRAETSGEGGEYFCNKAAALEQTTGYIIIPCTFDSAADVWYRVVFNPVNWAFDI
ncbi:hypothetical protein CBI38_13670 [Rhodococcus oxybenzonivorans]|uniref:Secreted protein n=1 Tax=Rhodococcus oxybenzonivorans TaxID=1990687 RepID=A0A2S2BV62_9NOCA|nr:MULTISPECIES: hypothetical protein [Rhodococcus]AWK72472.1 hypothetical protein CBI38_13670 [Rhodococcus oxybenzonivorans]QTJ64453.1 hypothetical protein HYG77_01790 [Rhodococcus sp. ZPP]